MQGRLRFCNAKIAGIPCRSSIVAPLSLGGCKNSLQAQSTNIKRPPPLADYVALDKPGPGPGAMVQQMTDLDRMLIKIAIQKAKPCPQDIADCLKLLVTEVKLFSVAKVAAYEDELWDVCRQAILAMGATSPTPPRGAISPPSLAGQVPRIPHSDGALLAAVRGSQDRNPDAIILATHGVYHYANARYTNAEFSYILHKTVKNVGLQDTGDIVRIPWNKPGRVARTTVFVPVSEEEAARAGMSVGILFGKHYREDHQVQLQAFASMDVESAPSSSQDQPHRPCASSVEAATEEDQEPELCSDRRSQDTQGHRDGLQKETAAFEIDGLWRGQFVGSVYCFVLGALVIWLWYGWGHLQ